MGMKERRGEGKKLCLGENSEEGQKKNGIGRTWMGTGRASSEELKKKNEGRAERRVDRTRKRKKEIQE